MDQIMCLYQAMADLQGSQDIVGRQDMLNYHRQCMKSADSTAQRQVFMITTMDGTHTFVEDTFAVNAMSANAGTPDD